MKFIKKQGCPQIYLQWCKKNAGTAMEDYRELTAKEKQPLLIGLIREQGGLCAYTMRRIDEDSAHVEHIKPESLCRAEKRGSDLDYRNLVACFPRMDKKKGCQYGARKKDDWWEEDGMNFVSPLHQGCESHFQFDKNGEIHAVGDHPAAVLTISVLGLDHPSLAEDRKRVIEEFIFGPGRDAPLSKAKTIQAKSAIIKSDGQGRFYEYCIAILHALDEHLAFVMKMAKKRKYARRKV